MKFKLLVLLLTSLAGLSAAAPARKTITHGDLWLMKRVSAPAPSPDGKWVVTLVTEPAYDAKEQAADLWLVAADGTQPPRRITQTKSPEAGTAWSPDSKKIAFSAKREPDEVAQLYVLDLAGGGEAERVTALTLGARSPKWSPDSKTLLFVSETYPGAADEDAVKKAVKERKDRKFNVRSYETFPIRYWDKWLDEKRVALFVQEARSGATARNLFVGSKLAGIPGFGGALTDEGETIDGEWTPDGAAVVFIATVNRHESAYSPVSAQLFVAPVAGGELQRLTNDTASYGRPTFAPDGRRLLCTLDENTGGKVYDVVRLASFPWPFRNERKILTAGYDRSVNRFAAPEGSDRIYFTNEYAGLEQLHSVGYAGGEVRDEASPATGCITQLDAGGAILTGLWESATSPAEAFIFGPGGPRELTSFNAGRKAALDWAPPEHFWFTASDGQKLHSMLVKPAGFDPAKKYPLLVLLHGGAANMWRDAITLRWNYHLLASPGYVVLLTDYKGSSGYGEEFARAIQFDPLIGPAKEVDEAADEAVKRFSFIDGSRQAAGGASYGGHLANWLQATTTRYKCIVSHAGEMDLVMQWGTSDGIYHREVNSGTPVWGNSPVWREQSPVLQGANHEKGTGFLTPILITVGEQDFRVPMNNAIMNFALQQRLRVPSKLLVFPEENHWISKGEDSKFWYGEVHAWLAQWLK